MDQKLWYIKKSGGVFSGLNESEMQTLADISRMVECQRKHQFYLSDELSDKIYLVKKGKVRLGKVNKDGNEITLSVLGPGEIFGELAITDEQHRSHFAEATEDTLVCVFPQDKFQKFLGEHPIITFKMMKLIGFRLRELETRLQDLAFKTVAERLRGTLLHLAEKYGSADKNGQIKLSITQKDIAFLVGATRESVAEELATMKRAGLVKTAYRSLLLSNLDALREQF
ncbi:cAMP-binding domain of CRP or a regulatory subunit of cAMP-dependent protein kinases [Desulfuromusa kysingii]|uniref:cAMP-binding domain of CRP or a regulatory subunit of cAMP-dependent protein kinases n=1 Tax=Desulfuromusa kysingii TaxID=37625 RepID=A0A1H4DCN3_9BACT|nr:Crp/Fnr family transcriptional regulator [Desulfuromusa kysingii]SEA70377.1 cAMP-binding domain of CRP or a regulatory subunit of cAMP-dependent protein kinases [Desulfuromusa kysingii]